ncbi:hypothetical protein CDL15_Pgr008627 [Punica granatum]|uniref:Uncharacterized protein n=1 Tax=Punica granatum TaxID=22663 RepID=A0A218XDG5_PUNGR|nr:hypothetical protein CDL15_Pgr008627 [Punica granatum]
MLLLERLNFVGCRICYWAIVLLLAMSRRCDEGFYFAGCCVLKDSSSGVKRLCIPSGRESEFVVVLAICFGSPKRPVKNFALTVQMDHVLRGLDARPPRVPVGYVWDYRDVPDNALAALSIVQRTHWL